VVQRTLRDLPRPRTGIEQNIGDDIELDAVVANVLTGIPGALEQLIARERWIRGYVRVRVHADPAVEGIVREAWRRIYNKLHTFDGSKGSFRAFALIWISHAIRDHLKASWPGQRLLNDQQQSVEWLATAEPMAASGPTGVPTLFQALRQVCETDIAPHELLAFGFGAFLQWYPSEVWKELAMEPFGSLLPKLELGLIQHLQWLTAYVDDLLANIHEAIEKGSTVEEAIPNTKAKKYYRRLCFGDLLQQPLGRTTLMMYSPEGADELRFSHDFTKWVKNGMYCFQECFLGEHE